MARKSSPPLPPPTPEDFSGMLSAHRQWERSGGKEGHQADFAGANLQGLDLTGHDLSGLNFRGANLVRAKFGDAHVEGASFRAADLREADMGGVRGLLAPQLAGADLAGAKLPDSLKEFAGVQHVYAASDHVQKLFFILLLVCVYCWLTIAVTTDANLLNNFAEQPLPIIGTKINLVMFYWAAPFLLLCVYLYFHLCLQRLWEALAELPAVFPDGLTLPQRVHPWLWNGLVWAYSHRLQDRRPPLLGLQKLLAIGLVWWAGPVTIWVLWHRYRPAHDWTVTLLQVVFLTLALGGALGFSLLTRATLRLQEKRLAQGKKLWRTVNGLALFLTTAAIAGLFLFLSLAAIEGVSKLPFLAAIDSFHGRPWVSADLTEADVSLKPPQWTGKPGDLDLVRGAFLRERNLKGVKAYKAFLVKADLYNADLERAYLRVANLQDANLSNANLQQADLMFANLQQANLRQASLQSADLRQANLQHTDLVMANLRQANLGFANLQHANLQLARLLYADLFEAKLQHAKLFEANLRHANLRLADFRDASLEKADLTGADLFEANLRGAKGLTREQLQSAIIYENTKLPDEFKDLVPNQKQKTSETMNSIDLHVHSSASDGSYPAGGGGAPGQGRGPEGHGAD